jgi:hypothetical protein
MENYNEQASIIFCNMIERWDRYKNDYIELYGEDAYYYYYQFNNEQDHSTFFDYTLDVFSDTESCGENMDENSMAYTVDNYGWEYDKYY